MSLLGKALAPGSRIGIIGGGQLGRMLAMAAARLGFEVLILTPDLDNCAGEVAGQVIIGGYTDPDALAQLAQWADVVTFEFENVPAATLEILSGLGCPVAPGAKALAVAQDRVDEKAFLNASGVPTVDFAPIASLEDLVAAVAKIGAPSLLKTRRDGYDGKGQVWIENHDRAYLEAAFQGLGARPCILEAPAQFVREVSVIAARAYDGTVMTYPLGENHHQGGILRRTLAPAQASEAIEVQAQTIAARILHALDYVGVMGVEMFELADGQLLVNEIAPRVHNTGHWTLDGCEVDQFEQHIRAIVGWPLGPTHALAQVEMLNLLGPEILGWADLAAEARARVWIYGKGEPRPGRKMGHVNRLSPLRS